MTTLQEKIIKPKLGLLELAKQLGHVSQACRVMGHSRDTFYRYKELYEKGGELSGVRCALVGSNKVDLVSARSWASWCSS